MSSDRHRTRWRDPRANCGLALDGEGGSQQSRSMALTLLTAAFFAITLSSAWFIGGEPERQGAWVLVGLLAAALLRRWLLGIEVGSIDLAGVVPDILAFLAFTWIALRAWRIWPLWAASLQLLAIASHVVRVLEIEIDPIVYAFMRSGPTYLVWLALLIGSISNRGSAQIGDSTPPWRSWFRR
jgi:hypothetical protein